MDTASGLVFYVARLVTNVGPPLAIAAFVLLAATLLAATLLAVAAVIDLLQPASGVLLASPIRW